MQCAAVTARSWFGLCTTLAVQKWVRRAPLLVVVNSAPTLGVPANGVPLGVPTGTTMATGETFFGIDRMAAANRTATRAAPCAAGVMAVTIRAAKTATPATLAPGPPSLPVPASLPVRSRGSRRGIQPPLPIQRHLPTHADLV